MSDYKPICKRAPSCRLKQQGTHVFKENYGNYWVVAEMALISLDLHSKKQNNNLITGSFPLSSSRKMSSIKLIVFFLISDNCVVRVFRARNLHDSAAPIAGKPICPSTQTFARVLKVAPPRNFGLIFESWWASHHRGQS